MAAASLSACLAEIKANPGKFYVYVLSRPCGTPFYVGKGRGERLTFHERQAILGKPGHKYAIIRKVALDGGSIRYSLAGLFDVERDAFAAEIAAIKSIGRKKHGGPLVNETDGGDGPSGFSQEITPAMRAKISASLTGRTKAPEHVAKVAAKRRGCKHSPEVRQKIAAMVNRSEARAKIKAARDGFTLSADSRAKISEAKRGRKLTPEHVAKIAASNRGKTMSTEARAKQSAAARLRPPMSEETKAKIRAARANQAPMSAEAKEKCRLAAQAMQARRKSQA